MRILNNADFLTLWEIGHPLHPLDRGLLAIRASLSDELATDEQVADWPLGRRNRALAELRALYFGPRLKGWMACSQCGEKLEFEVDCRSLAETQTQTSTQTITLQGSTFRLPTSRDLAHITHEADPQRAAMLLLENCTLEHATTGPASWTETEIEAVTEEMAHADPLAEIALDFECPVCGHISQEALDLPGFVWAEIETRAKRILIEVHALASRYGWAESAILAMSEPRRAAYLQMVQA